VHDLPHAIARQPIRPKPHSGAPMTRTLLACFLWYVLGAMVTRLAYESVPRESHDLECLTTLDRAAERLAWADEMLGPCWQTAAWYQAEYVKRRRP
jgi:hypothetical protein